MALDQSALPEVLEALKAAEVDDRIRQAAETIDQALTEAELSSVIGALPHERNSARTGRPKTLRISGLPRTPKPRLRQMLRQGSAISTWRMPATSG